MTGDLPIRSGDVNLPAFKQYFAKYPGEAMFVDNLKNVIKAASRDAALPEDLDGHRDRRSRRCCWARRSRSRRSTRPRRR